MPFSRELNHDVRDLILRDLIRNLYRERLSVA
jgi:hypothetical protein